VAPVRPVDDRTARRMMQDFYRELSAGSSLNPVSALRRAQAAVNARSPASDWASFRVIVP
jgi:CHAT domain-containing protein